MLIISNPEECVKINRLSKKEEQKLATIIQDNFSSILEIINCSDLLLSKTRQYIKKKGVNLKPHPQFIRLIRQELKNYPDSIEISNKINQHWDLLKEAVYELVLKNTQLCKHLAIKIFGEYYQEVVSYGTEGLIISAYYFKPGNSSFSTYASWWIKKRIHKYFEENRYGQILLSHHKYVDFKEVKKSFEELRVELGRSPNAEEISRDTNVPIESALGYMNVLTPIIKPLNSPLGPNDWKGGSHLDIIANNRSPIPEDQFSDQEIISKIIIFLEKILTKKELTIFWQKVVLDKGFKEIGEQFGEGQANMSRIYLKTCSKIRRKTGLLPIEKLD